MDQSQIFLWLNLAVFNFATVRLLMVSLARVDIKEALIEKSMTLPPVHSTGTTTDLSDSTKATLSAPELPSYSRVAGMIGAVVLAAFLWGLGNIVLYKALEKPEDLVTILGNVGTFFLAGSSLFAPYAFNQLRAVFDSSNAVSLTKR